MANYVTKAEVHDTADLIDGKGQKPTTKNIRQELGHGSYTTIEKHLATWAPIAQRVHLPPVPEWLNTALAATATDLWLLSQAKAKEETSSLVQEAAAREAEARQAAAYAAEIADRLTDELRAERESNAALEDAIADKDQRIEEFNLCIQEWVLADAHKSGEIESLRSMLNKFAPVIVEQCGETEVAVR